MALGTFTVTINGDQLGAGTEKTAKVRVQFAGSGNDVRAFIKDTDADKFVFPHRTNPNRQPVSLPYSLVLKTDVTSGVSTGIGYFVTVTTEYGGVVSVGPFGARPAGSTVSLVDLASDFEGQVAESIAVRAESAAAEAEAAKTAAEAVGNTNDTIIASRLNDPASATYAAAADKFARKRSLPLEAFGTPVVDGSANMKALIQTAIDAANTAYAADGRPRVVELPHGILRTDSQLEAKNGVWLKGQGHAATMIRPSAAHTSGSVFWKLGNEANPLTDAAFTDFTIDGADQTYSTYDVSRKGIYVEFHQNVRYERLRIRNTLATGLGVDHFHGNCLVQDNLIEGCGRANSGTGPGGNGIGLGTGGFSDGIDSVLVTGNYVTGTGRFGIMVERQDYGYRGRGVRIIGNYCTANQHGIVDCGAEGAVITGNVCNANTGYGIGVNYGTFIGAGSNPRPGSRGLIANNTCSGNGTHGIAFDLSNNQPEHTGYLVTANQLYSNGGAGIRVVLSIAGRDPKSLRFIGNQVRNNAAEGFYLSGNGGVLVDAVIEGNDFSQNGIVGVRVGAPTQNLRIVGNSFHDRQGVVTQTKGVRFDANGHTDVDVHGNDFTAMSIKIETDAGATMTRASFKDNKTYNPLGVANRTITASPMTYTAASTPEALYVIGGTVTSVTKGGTGLGSVGPWYLEPNEQVVITYSATPTAIRADRR